MMEQIGFCGMMLDAGYEMLDARFARLRWPLSFIQYPASRIQYRSAGHPPVRLKVELLRGSNR
jgi:hypothetical protein